MNSTQTHDFGRPWHPTRKKIYWAMFILCLFVCLVPYAGVLLHWWDAEPSGTIAAGLVCIPIIVPMLVAWWDQPGENRTTLERAYEFMLVWFPISAASQVLWETTWLIGDALGYMNLGPEDRWGWFWYFYGAADTRFIKSDPGLFGMESLAVIGGVTLMFAHTHMMGKARHNDRLRSKALWLCFFCLSLMLAVFIIYYIAEFRVGFANVEQGFWGFALKFVFMNLPWLAAPLISLPLIVQMQRYLIAKEALEDAGHDAEAASERAAVLAQTPARG